MFPFVRLSKTFLEKQIVRFPPFEKQIVRSFVLKVIQTKNTLLSTHTTGSALENTSLFVDLLFPRRYHVGRAFDRSLDGFCHHVFLRLRGYPKGAQVQCPPQGRD